METNAGDDERAIEFITFDQHKGTIHYSNTV